MRNEYDEFGKFLKWAYWDLGYSTHSLARLLFTNQEDIRRLMIAYGIPRRKHEQIIPYNVIGVLAKKWGTLERGEKGIEIKRLVSKYSVTRRTVYHNLKRALQPA